MELRALLKVNFGIDFPISGGTGNLRDNPIIIHRQEPNDHTSVEYGILRCLGIGRRVEWELIQQSLIHYNGTMLDQLKIRTKKVTDTEIITQVENYYFDISECIDF
jgi:hypothetical protein